MTDLAAQPQRKIPQALARVVQSSVSATHWFGKDQRQRESLVEHCLTCLTCQKVEFVLVHLAIGHFADERESGLWLCLHTGSICVER